jgi:cytochrome P450
MATSTIPAVKQYTIRQQGIYRMPDGLRMNLPLYILRRFFRPTNPIVLFEHMVATYGNASSYRVFNTPIVFLNEPEWVQELLVTKAPQLTKERTQRRMKILLGEGLITSEGSFHMRQRRIAAPAFHRQRIQSYAHIMAEQGAILREQWQPGTTLDIAKEMMHLSLEVVARTLFATEVTPEVRSISDEVNVVMDLYTYLISMPRAEEYLHWPLPGFARFRRARRRIDTTMAEMIARRRASGEDRGDLLSMLITARDTEDDRSGMTDEQLRDEVVTIFLAGYETMANALSWTWYLLSQNPEVEARFHSEIDRALEGRLPTMEDIPRLNYVERVLAESMRLFPPVWAMGRQASEDMEIGPFFVRKGTMLYVSQYLMQRDARFFPDPLRFDPDRFLPERAAERPRFSYFPFGAGGRQCIGEAFAWMEGTLLLATLAQRWKLRLVPGYPVEIQPKITLRPKHGIRMVVEARQRAILC